MKVINLTKKEFNKRISNLSNNSNGFSYLGDKPCIIDFFANWCGPCKSLSPILEELAKENDTVYIYKVDVDAERELATLFNIQSIPTLFFIPLNGKLQIKQGAMSKKRLQQLIDTLLLKK